jgi:hypothetical protein
MAVPVMTAASVPPIVVAASAVHVAVAVTAPVPDLDHGAVFYGDRGHAEPGGCRCGHGQRSNQCGSNQGDASHQMSSRSRDCDVRHKRAGERLFRRASSKMATGDFQRFCGSDDGVLHPTDHPKTL